MNLVALRVCIFRDSRGLFNVLSNSTLRSSQIAKFPLCFMSRCFLDFQTSYESPS